MTQPWMPLYVADYLADTRRLSTLEHGAYMLLIMEYWRKGGLPNEDKKLARIVGLSENEWLEIRDGIADLFSEGWRHKRIDKEILRAEEKSGKARDSAAKRWNNDRNANVEHSGCERIADGHANDMLSQSQSQSDKISSLRSDSATERKQKSEDVRAVLAEVVSDETASDIIAHRKALKSPMTAGAAKGLAKAFRAYGDPEGAARAMMANGWKGFDPVWMQRSAPARAGPGTLPPKRNPYFRDTTDKMKSARHDSDDHDATRDSAIPDADVGDQHHRGPTLEGCASAGGRGELFHIDGFGPDAGRARRA